MPILIGLLILCAVFIVFGSKTEEASVLYYDPPGAEQYLEPAPSEEEEPIVPTQSAPVEEAPAAAAAGTDAAEIARGIYDDLDL